MNSAPRRRVEKRRAPVATVRILACDTARICEEHTSVACKGGRGCWENDNVALETKICEYIRENAWRRGRAKGRIPSGMVCSRRKMLRNPPSHPRTGIYLPPIALGSRPWKVNELCSLFLSLLLSARLENCEQCNFFCQRLLALGLPCGILSLQSFYRPSIECLRESGAIPDFFLVYSMNAIEARIYYIL